MNLLVHVYFEVRCGITRSKFRTTIFCTHNFATSLIQQIVSDMKIIIISCESDRQMQKIVHVKVIDKQKN